MRREELKILADELLREVGSFHFYSACRASASGSGET